LRLRLFFAMWPDESVREALGAAARPLLEACPGKPVPRGNYHLTLAFLGAVEASRLEALRAAAAGVRAEPFDLVMDCHGHWARPRVAWLGCRQPPAASARLAAAAWAALAPLGFKAEERPFVPHLTVLRHCRACAWPGPVTPVDWPVRDFALVSSVTRAAGPEYTVIERRPLA
jgi:RNA 2',3'-cyclic 3'-phosphodiesterase